MSDNTFDHDAVQLNADEGKSGNDQATTSGKIQVLQQEYMRQAHAMQSGVAMVMNYPDHGETEPKHLRVGVNSSMVETGVILKLLVDKGIISELEMWELLVGGMRAQVSSYEDIISRHLGGAAVTLS